MDKQRRSLLVATGALGAATVLPASANNTSCDSGALPPVVHMVYFWLRNPSSESDRDKLISGLRSLTAIPEIASLHVGLPASTLKRDVIDNSFHVSELMMFHSVADQDTYQNHPLHVKFVEEHAHLWDKVVVHDSISAP